MSSRTLQIASVLVVAILGSACGSHYEIGIVDASATRQDDDRVTFEGTLNCNLTGVENCGTTQCVEVAWYPEQGGAPAPDLGSDDGPDAADTSADATGESGDAGGSRSGSGTTYADIRREGAVHDRVVGAGLKSRIDTNAEPFDSTEVCHDGVLTDANPGERKGGRADVTATSNEPIPTEQPYVVQARISEVQGQSSPGIERPSEVYLRSP